MLSKEEKEDSYDAVRQLLLQGGENLAENGGEIRCRLKVGPQESDAELTISTLNHVPAYNLDSDAMYSFLYKYGKKRSISTAYEIFEWDDENKLLVFEFGGRFPMKIKRIS
jgi:hypothetical protein